MTGEGKSSQQGTGKSGNANGGTDRDPAWANSLRKLYDSVVDEPLPDNFKDLLSKLDEKS